MGAGVQILGMMLVTLVAACLGMLSPASRGSMMTTAIVIYMFMGLFAGYIGGRLYRSVDGQLNWLMAALRVGIFFPAVVFGFGFFLNFFIWGQHSSGAVPPTTMLALLLLWLGISLPLVVIGFYFGNRKGAFANNISVNQIPRQVPPQPTYLKRPLA